jgi:molecular chaperone DnaK
VQSPDEQDPIIGIDLGTSNCVVAHCDNEGHARVLVDQSGYKVHPSIVSFHPNGSVVVGSQAKQRRILDPKHTVYSAKRLIGRSFDSPEVALARQRMPYEIRAGENNSPTIVTRGGQFAVPEISAIVLDHVRDIAASALQAGVNRAVVTVPANFNDAQRSATATAGAIAGLTILRVLNEPTAAALAYGHSRPMQEIFAVYDFGGGTFDVTVLRLQGQVYEVLGTAGHSFLGGDDLDERLVEMMVDHFLREQRVDLRTNEIAMMRMRAVAEQTKIELSRRSRAILKIDEVAYGPNGAPINLQMEVTRDAFVSKVSDVVDSTFPVCAEALKIAGIAKDRIGEVILVGGTTKMPYVRDQVARFFGQGPRTDANPEEAVALGASLQAVAMQRLLGRTKALTARAMPTMRPPAAAVDSNADDASTEIGGPPSPPTFPAGGLPAIPPVRKTQAYQVPARIETARPSSRGSTVDRLFSDLKSQTPAAPTAGAPLARLTPKPVTAVNLEIVQRSEPSNKARPNAPITIPPNEEITIDFPNVDDPSVDEEFAIETESNAAPVVLNQAASRATLHGLAAPEAPLKLPSAQQRPRLRQLAFNEPTRNRQVRSRSALRPCSLHPSPIKPSLVLESPCRRPLQQRHKRLRPLLPLVLPLWWMSHPMHLASPPSLVFAKN